MLGRFISHSGSLLQYCAKHHRKQTQSSWQSFQAGQIHFRMTKPQHNHSAKINTPSHPSPSCPHQGLSHTLLVSLTSLFYFISVSH